MDATTTKIKANLYSFPRTRTFNKLDLWRECKGTSHTGGHAMQQNWMLRLMPKKALMIHNSFWLILFYPLDFSSVRGTYHYATVHHHSLQIACVN